MSAWIVSKVHIDLLVTAGLTLPKHNTPMRWNQKQTIADWTPRQLTRATADAVGSMLWAENVASVSYRYPDDESADTLPGPIDFEGEQVLTYQFQEVPGVIDVAAVFKSIDCYEYQTCEHPGWETSEARRFCEALRDTCVGRVPGYDAAPWGFDDRDYFRNLTRVSPNG